MSVAWAGTVGVCCQAIQNMAGIVADITSVTQSRPGLHLSRVHFEKKMEDLGMRLLFVTEGLSLDDLLEDTYFE